MDIFRSRHRAFFATLFTTLAVLRCGGSTTDPQQDDDTTMPTEQEVAVCAATGNETWLWVDVAEGQKPELSLDEFGTPHLAFMLEDEMGWVKYTTIRPSDGQVGELTTIAEGYFYGPFGLDVAQGRTWVAFHNHFQEDQNLLVLEIDGNWFTHRMEREGHDGWHNSVEVGPLGTLHTATIDPSAFSGDGVVYATFQDGMWDIEVAAQDDLMYDWGLSLTVADDGTVYVAFFDALDGVAKIARRNGPASWDVAVVEPVPSAYMESGRFPNIAVDDAGNLHLAYLARGATPNQGAIRYATGTFDNLTAQEVAVVDDIQVDDVFDFTAEVHGARNIVDLELASDGRPVLVYQSRSVTYVARGNGAGFDIEELPAAEDVELRQQVSMGLDGSDRIHLTYWLDGQPGQVCYARSE